MEHSSPTLLRTFYERYKLTATGATLHQAIQRGNTRKAVRLIRRGFPMILPVYANVCPDMRKLSPLQFAVFKELDEVVSEFLRAGVLVTEIDATFFTAMRYKNAVWKLDTLLALGATLDLHRQYDRLPVDHFTRWATELSLTNFLRNCPQRELDSYHQRYGTPLFLAIDMLSIERVRLLIASGANVNARCDFGTSVERCLSIHSWPKRKPVVEILQALWRAGATCDPNVLARVSINYYTPELLRTMFSIGADPSGVWNGVSVLEFCILAGPQNLHELLLHGADASVRTSNGRTILELSKEPALYCKPLTQALFVVYGGSARGHLVDSWMQAEEDERLMRMEGVRSALTSLLRKIS